MKRIYILRLLRAKVIKKLYLPRCLITASLNMHCEVIRKETILFESRDGLLTYVSKRN